MILDTTMLITKERVIKAIRDPRYAAHKIKEKVSARMTQWGHSFGYAPPPEYVTLFLTSHCNLRCRMCAQYGEAGTSYEIEKSVLSTSLIKKLVDELAPYRTKFTLLGGEPLLHPDCAEITRYIKNAGCECSLITNGVTLSKQAGSICESGMDFVNISIDGIGETHDVIRGVSGTWGRVIHGLDTLIELRNQSGTRKPRITVFYTITEHNYGELVEFAEWAEQKGVDAIQYCHLRFYSMEDYQENALYMQEHLGQTGECQGGFIFDPGDIDTEVLKKQVQELRSRTWCIDILVVPNHALEDYEDYYHTNQYRRPSTSSCNVPWTNAGIAPTGMVVPCMDYLCGNLEESTFTEIWNGKRFRKFRCCIYKQKRFPICHRCCV
jgi:MoaA/NifB/PqqE/SkfB family radical SAM enzyme